MTDDTGCPACGSGQRSRTFDVAEMMFGRDETFTYAQCGDCETVCLLTVPVDLGSYYPTDYYSIDTDPEQALGGFPRRPFAQIMGRSALFGKGRLVSMARRVISMRQFHTLMSLLDSVARAGGRSRSTRVLDVGCGSGALVYALALSGVHDVTGVDPFAPGDRTFDNGARIRRAGLDDLGSTYDLVMFHHSFEHVPDPRASLEAGMQVLADDGRILVRMPTVSSEAFETYGPQWVQLDAPRHLAVFSRAGMDRLAQGVGLVVEQVWDDSTAFQFWGSEQVRRGVPLMDPESLMHNADSSLFTKDQLAIWHEQSKRLNRASRGDQAVWVLRRATPA